MSATCKYGCKTPIFWAALEGRTLPFEKGMAGDPKAFDLYSVNGTTRARPHPGGSYPNIPTYRRHHCPKGPARK